ncbi:MAG: hypothetical protein SWE60_25095, partial [Thermodesulfobacteriota bacterium]|nr:hypothetical protein [Thermodesulfobacteriota bacterium]
MAVGPFSEIFSEPPHPYAAKSGGTRLGTPPISGDGGCERRDCGGEDLEEAVEQPRGDRKKAAIKASILVAFIIGAILLVRWTPIRGYLTPEALGRLLDRAGLWAPLIFIVIYTLGICLFVPGTLLTGLGAAIFGAYWGFVYVWVGAMLGASAAFWIGRSLGREFAASLIGDRLK